MTDYKAVTQKINTILKTPEPAGNMFSKSSLIDPLDEQRDTIVNNVKTEYNNQTTVMTVNKQLTDVIGFFKNTFNLDTNSVKKNNNEIANIQSNIKDTNSDLDQITSTSPVVQSLIALVSSVVILYLFGSILGSFIHTVAFIILGVGLWHIISTLPSNGQSAISSFFSSIYSALQSAFSSLTSSL
jgi:C4-dicarboxylate transporter